MPALPIPMTGGIAPRRHPSRLPAGFAVQADDCAFDSGTLKAAKASPVVHTLPNPKPIKSIFRLGAEVNDETKYWLAWQTDVRVAVGAVAGDPTERVYWTGDGEPKMTTLEHALTGSEIYPVRSFTLGIPKPTGKPTCQVIDPPTPPAPTTGGGTTPEPEPEPVDKRPVSTRAYVVTLVSGLGEEGAPCAATDMIDVRQGQHVILREIGGAPAGNFNLSAKRIYRSQTDDYGRATWRFVAEIPIAQTEYTDDVADGSLGEPLASEFYEMPPTGMQHLTAMPNGIYAGATGYDLLFSDPYVPYAWPVANWMTVNDRIVGLACFGQSLLVATEGYPYLAGGIDPQAMSVERLDIMQACASAKSVLSLGHGAVYAGADGLVYVGQGGSRVATEAIWDRDQWQAMKPATMQCLVHNSRLIIIAQDVTLAIDGLLSDMPLVTTLSVRAVAGYLDPRHDALFLLDEFGRIMRYGAGEPLVARWKSGVIDCGAIPHLSCARVRCDGAATVTIYFDGKPFYTRTVNGNETFRLPTGKPDRMQIEVVTSGSVRGIWLSAAMAELKGL